MAEDYDSRLLESARVRKHRLDDSLLFGQNPHERNYKTATARLMQSLLIAASSLPFVLVSVLSSICSTNRLPNKQGLQHQQLSSKEPHEHSLEPGHSYCGPPAP